MRKKICQTELRYILSRSIAKGDEKQRKHQYMFKLDILILFNTVKKYYLSKLI